MKQLLQSVSTGEAIVAEVPAPKAGYGQVLVRVSASLISAGTERTAVDFAEKNLLQKAMSRPDLVKQVLDKAKREGLLSTIDTVRNRLDTDLALGYSNAGTVIAVGDGVTEFKAGDRVACAGGGYASHAEIVRVPRNLVARIPDAGGREVPFEESAFTTVGAIALQALRLAEPQLGETVAVIGLGLIGLIAVQLAKASGCTVVGMDINPQRCALAERLGCDATATDAGQMNTIVETHSNARGADVVIITAATKSNAPVELAGEIARDRGRVVALGAVGLDIPRKHYYEKELFFQVSRSYGAGRYDPEYEEKGHDYPIGYVRWTEQRNMEAFLLMLAEGKVRVAPLITHRFPIDDGVKGYEIITGKTGEPFLGVVLTYPADASTATRIELRPAANLQAASDRVAVGMVGAGGFATGVLLPAMKKVPGIELVGVCTASGSTAHGVGKRLGFRFCATDQQQVLSDPTINTIVVATRHHLHARQVSAALRAGKNVFCEKPLCVNEQELAELAQLYTSLNPSPMLMVGFNRRFAPMALEMGRFAHKLGEPMMMHYRVNAGYIPLTHWTQDKEQGAGRIVGEACHFVDFLSFLTGSLVRTVQVAALPNHGRYNDDNVVAVLTYENGSVGTIAYTAAGDKTFPKERVEMFGSGAVAVLDDFRSLLITQNGKRKELKSHLRQDKGHRGEWEAIAEAMRKGEPSPISFEQIVNTTLTTFAIIRGIASGEAQTIDTAEFIAGAGKSRAATEGQ
jgi:predicted dehydrogenase/threonine dehydrogenase-like Zn-dependent dehydrogenase